jgi:predicted transcriptional regulator
MADLQGTFKEAWSVAVAGVTAAEQEAGKVLNRLAEVAGLSQEDVRRYAREVEQKLDEAVRRASVLLPPSQEDLAALTRRLDAVAERLARIEKDKGSG